MIIVFLSKNFIVDSAFQNNHYLMVHLNIDPILSQFLKKYIRNKSIKPLSACETTL